MKDFDLIMKLRNNRILERRENLGISAPEAARLIGIGYQIYLDYEYLRKSPFKPFSYLELKETAAKICDFFGVLPEELWPDIVLKVQRSVIRRKLDEGDVSHLISDNQRLRMLPPDEFAEIVEQRSIIEEELTNNLSERERDIIIRRFGFVEDEETLDCIASKIGRSRTRIGQIEGRALRKIRHSESAKKLKETL